MSSKALDEGVGQLPAISAIAPPCVGLPALLSGLRAMVVVLIINSNNALKMMCLRIIVFFV
jgi:hypothetical protein